MISVMKSITICIVDARRRDIEWYQPDTVPMEGDAFYAPSKQSVKRRCIEDVTGMSIDYDFISHF